jgi:beta-glucosidase
MDETSPSARDAIVPSGLHILKNYIYPYISSADDIKQGSYPYPDGYDTKQKQSPAGGGEGGNPHLWDVHVDVEVTLANTGDIPGQEVVQLYVSFPSNVPIKVDQFGAPVSDATNGPFVDFPVRVLRGFEKVDVLPGRSETVKFRLTRKDLSYWNVEHQNWAMPMQGHFKFYVGRSSRDLPLSAEW